MMTNRIRAKSPSGKNKSLVFYAILFMVMIGLARFLIYINESSDEFVNPQVQKVPRLKDIDTTGIPAPKNKTGSIVTNPKATNKQAEKAYKPKSAKTKGNKKSEDDDDDDDDDNDDDDDDEKHKSKAPNGTNKGQDIKSKSKAAGVKDDMNKGT